MNCLNRLCTFSPMATANWTKIAGGLTYLPTSDLYMSCRTLGVLDQCAAGPCVVHMGSTTLRAVQGHTKTRHVPKPQTCTSTNYLCHSALYYTSLPLTSPSSPPPPLHTPSPPHSLTSTLPLPPLHTPSPAHSLTSHRTSGRAIINCWTKHQPALNLIKGWSDLQLSS